MATDREIEQTYNFMTDSFITLADGTKIPVSYGYQGKGDDQIEVTLQEALKNAGYLSADYINQQDKGTVDYFNKTYGTNFASPIDYTQWLYGPGGQLIESDAGMLYKPPAGMDDYVNQPLSYDPVDFTDRAWMLPLGVAGAGLYDMGAFSNLFGGDGGLLGGDASWGANLRPDSLASMQEIDGSMQTIYDAMAGAGVSGYDPALTYAGMGSGGLDDFFKGLMPSGSTVGNILGKIAPAALGAYGANQQADAFRDAQNQYFSLGDPFRKLLEKSYAPGFSLENEPGYKAAIDTATNSMLRGLSTQVGNPWDSPGAQAETLKYVMGSTALPYLTNYRSGLSGAGQLGVGPSAQFSSNAIQSQGGLYDALGYGLNEVFNPKPDYTQQFLDIMKNWNYSGRI